MTKRLVFSILMVLALTAGAAYAQSTINTPAPGPTQQLEPGQTNNNLPNPGNPVNVGPNAEQQPLQEQGTVEGTATESLTGQQGANTTGNLDTTGTATGTTTGTMDTTTTTEVDTVDTTTDTSLSDTDTLPGTASKLPLVGLIGLLALAAAFAVRRF